eukprot:7293272-Prymnesium_polylepis.2
MVIRGNQEESRAGAGSGMRRAPQLGVAERLPRQPHLRAREARQSDESAPATFVRIVRVSARVGTGMSGTGMSTRQSLGLPPALPNSKATSQMRLEQSPSRSEFGCVEAAGSGYLMCTS